MPSGESAVVQAMNAGNANRKATDVDRSNGGVRVDHFGLKKWPAS
jgi:hypothetical protein